MSQPIAIYCDGGVIASNPSSIGGTYAVRYIYADGRMEGAGYVLSAKENGGPVTNNQTEMMAVLAGLQFVPNDWAGTIYSDSAVTLGRIFLGWKWNNIPQFIHRIFQLQRQRLENWEKIKHVQLDGHPTKAQLVSGIGKRGNPVSEHNVWCDEACRQAGELYLRAQMVNFSTLVPS